MKTKQELLAELREGLTSGIITEADIKPFVILSEGGKDKASEPDSKPDRLSAVDVMFYIAGIVLFATIMSIIGQSWSDGNSFVHILLSAVMGAGLWSIAYYLIKSPFQNEIRSGLTNALLLTGSLLLIAGGYIITNEVIGGFNEVNFMPIAIILVVLGGLHMGFDRLIKRDLTLLTGIILAVAAFPTLIFEFLQDSGAPRDVWSVIFIISAGLLAYTTRVVAKINPDRKNIHRSFDFFAAFLALLSMYVASHYGSYDLLWFGALIAAVLGLFYLSITLQNKHLLGTGSFFMVLTVITVSFKYFSGYGITVSLIIATLGLLGSAAVASGINKKYFKHGQ